jgi:hypothetical protein
LEPEGLLAFTQGLSAEPYPKPGEFIQHLQFSHHRHGLPRDLFPLDFGQEFVGISSFCHALYMLRQSHYS